MRVAILLCGHIRSWDVCKQAFMTAISDIDCDVYVSTYNILLGYHPYMQTSLMIDREMNRLILSPAEIGELIGLNCEVVTVNNTDSITPCYNSPVLSDIFSQYNTIKQCLDSVIMSGKQYDLVIKTRFDITYSEPFINFIRDNNNQNLLLLSSGPSVQPCDQVFIGTISAIKDLLDNLLGSHTRPVNNPHEWLDICLKNIPHKIAISHVTKTPLVTTIIRKSG